VLTEPIAAALRDMVVNPIGGRTELVVSPLEPDAALLGAVALVVDAHRIAIDPLPAWVHAVPAHAT